MVATRSVRSWLLVLLAAAAPAQGEGPAVRVVLDADPPAAFLHQQVVLRVRVTHPLGARPRWEAPTLDGFWTERLSTRGGPLERDARGRPFRTTEFRRALFPTRTGTLAVSASVVRYRDAQDEERSLLVPTTQIRVSALPEAGRPAAYGEVVGPVQIRAELTREEVGVGRGVQLAVEIWGPANVWDAPLPGLEDAFGEGVEVFADRPRLVTGEQAGRLTARRSLGFDLVPWEPGVVRVPALAVAWFDPQTGIYRVARSEATALRVVAGFVERPNPFLARRAHRNGRPELPWIPLAIALLALGGGVTIGLTRWWRSALRFAPPVPRPRSSFERACAAIGEEAFPTRLADAIKAGIHVRHGFDARALATEEIAARGADPAAIELLRALDRARFGRPPGDAEALLPHVRTWLGL